MAKLSRFLVLCLLFLLLILIPKFQYLKTPISQSPHLPTPSPVSSSLRFAVISDIHSDLANLQLALSKLQNQNIAFLVLTGDLTTVGDQKELQAVKKQLDDSQITYYTIPGNHDLWTGNQRQQNIFVSVFGPDYQSFFKDKFKFILINNGDWRGLEKNQLDWLNQQLKDCLAFDCIVFAHIPLNHPLSTHIMGEDNAATQKQGQELLRLLVKYRIRQLYSGHIHYSSHFELSGLKTTIVGSLSSDRNPQLPRYLLVELSAAGFSEPKINENEVILD